MLKEKYGWDLEPGGKEGVTSRKKGGVPTDNQTKGRRSGDYIPVKPERGVKMFSAKEIKRMSPVGGRCGMEKRNKASGHKPRQHKWGSLRPLGGAIWDMSFLRKRGPGGR